MVILICIGVCLIIYGLYIFTKATVKLLKAFYYWKIADDNRVDKGYIKHILSKTDEYKEFQNKVDRDFKNGI